MAAPMKKDIERALDSVSALTQHPEDFLIAQKASAKKFTATLKTIYDNAKRTEPETKTSVSALPELIVKGFDDEQIWQQLELQNDVTISKLVSGVARLLADKKRLSFHSKASIEKDTTRKQKPVEKRKLLGRHKPKYEVSDDGDLDEEENDSVAKDTDSDHSDVGELSDDELSKIKSHVGKDEEDDDKFFDFTGDSDDDLNFDFGPLGKGGVSESDDDSEENDGAGGIEGSDIEELKDVTNQKTKKSVRFKELENTEINKGKKKKETDVSIKSGCVVDDAQKDKSKKKREASNSNKKGSVVDDAFFKLADLEAFLDQEDKREERRQRREKLGDIESDSDDDDEEEDIDVFAELNSENEDLHYEDFFDPPDMPKSSKGKDKARENEVNQGSRESDADSGEDDDHVGIDEEEVEEEEIGGDDEEETDDDNDGDKNSSEEEDTSLRQRKPMDLLGDSDSEGEDVGDILGGRKKKQKSSFEQRQEKLKKKISAMETEAVAEKPWQLSGEITATSRPENSLLQENVEFEHTTRLPPEITEETTKTLEELILQRIKDKAFDDVERKIKPKDNPFEYKKRITLDQEKSKLSLGEIYEQEYLKQQQKEEEEKSDPDHEQIKKMMQSLFVRLDALSNFHYTPKQAAPEVKIVSNQPSISMEEVAPVSFSENKLLAPEEVKEKEKGELKGATEKTKTDKLRERKKKKTEKRERQKEKEKRQKLIEKLNPGLGNKYSKEKALRQLEKESKSGRGVSLIKDDKNKKTGLTSSKAFFTQLQDEVTAHINTKKAEKRKKDGKVRTSSKKFKL